DDAASAIHDPAGDRRVPVGVGGDIADARTLRRQERHEIKPEDARVRRFPGHVDLAVRPLAQLKEEWIKRMGAGRRRAEGGARKGGEEYDYQPRKRRLTHPAIRRQKPAATQAP